MVLTQLNRRKSNGQLATYDVGVLTDELQTGSKRITAMAASPRAQPIRIPIQLES
jgi:hypothetical protein